ncbi:MAG: Fic family protein [Isosphaeraceae bacterium]
MDTIAKLSKADLALGELKGVGQMLPNPHLLIPPFLRREAVSSSRIEGTVTDLEQLLRFEADPSEGEDAGDRQEVFNYVSALEFGLRRLHELPVSLRLMREVHERLMHGVRGEDKLPGEFRNRQNMIGRQDQSPQEARFVPPPVGEMQNCLRAMEAYIGNPSNIPPLIDLALIHYQFESIHPFLDGNGRLGRLLISLLLSERGCLSQPLLNLSSYFERDKDTYMDSLLAISQRAAWNRWIDFFLDGVAIQSRSAISRSNKLLRLRDLYNSKVREITRSSSALQLVDMLFERPAVTVSMVAERLGITFRAAQLNVEKLLRVNVLREATGNQRNRIYVAREIIATIQRDDDDGTTPYDGA